jgi:raffinose/stachyose/melibiose transport system permease protein
MDRARGGRAMKRGKGSFGLDRYQNLTGYLFLSPLLAIFSVFLLYSIYYLIKTSFSFMTISFSNPRPVGLSNYGIVFGDAQFYKAILNTFLLSASGIFVGLSLGFVLAVFLSFRFKGRGFFGTLFFVPTMLPIALVAAVFGLMLEYNDGLINNAIRALGIGFLDLRWLSDPKLAMGSVMSMSIFLVGVPLMYYSADLTSLDKSVFEAAVLDGAGMRHILWRILYPLLKSTHKTIALSLLLGGFREMERVFLMTDSGPGGATDIIGTYIFRNARSAGSNLGFVSAAAVVVLLLALGISLLQLVFYPRPKWR